ncbi:MAG TPA: universal stress protein [Candidatus Eisenbacteria bacterium]|nr:universal stress protein [Candidatus Eisenbacteria bacterium]
MRKGFRRVLVPHDFSTHADRALRTALGLAARQGARLTVLHVTQPIGLVQGFPPTVIFQRPTQAMLANLTAQLARRVKRVAGRTRGGAPAVRVAVGDPHREIVAAARRADLIVMGTQGLTGLPHLLIGSVAEKVVRHSPVPVMTVPRPGKRG